jgi:hypothetical protein
MKESYLRLGFFLVILFVTGCKNQQSDNDAIRSGICPTASKTNGLVA